MIGIGEIRSEIPERRLDNRERMEALGVDATLLESKMGVERVARLPAGADTSDLAIAAVKRLFATGSVRPEEVESLFLVTQNPDGHGLPHTSAILHERLSLPPSCVCLDLSLGCSGFVVGASVLRGFMESHGQTRGLLVTSDPYSKVLDESDRNTALIFGDAAAATLLSDRPRWWVRATDFGSDGSRRDALEVRKDGRLFMNGRAVFNFSATVVPRSIESALERAGLGVDDVDRFLLHQGSRYIVERIAQRVGAGDRAAFAAGDYGNTVSSSVPILLERETKDSDRVVVVSGFGVGLSWGTAVLERADAD